MTQGAIARAFLPGGLSLSVDASAGGIKLPPFKGLLAQHAHKAVALARLTEPVEDLRDDLRLSTDWTPGLPTASGPLQLATQLLETAAVLVDRVGRGCMQTLPEQGAVVLACSADDWLTGQLASVDETWAEDLLQALLDQHDLGEVLVLLPGESTTTADWGRRIKTRHPRASVRIADNLLHFSGSLDALRRPRAAEVLFPVLAGSGLGALYAARVVVSHLPAGKGLGSDISVVGSNKAMASHAEKAVKAVRDREPPSRSRWQTVIHLPDVNADGHSFELAVVLADRMARGREWPGPGRVIATGGIDSVGSFGSVLDVGNTLGTPGAPSKTDLIRREALPYDTVLLPSSWLLGMPALTFDMAADLDLRAWPQVVYVDNVLG